MIREHNAAARYLTSLATELRGLPAETRGEILADVRAHIDEATESGRDIDEVLTKLGDPADVATDAREQLGGDSLRDPAERPERMLRIAALVLAIVSAVVVSFLLPSYAIEEVGTAGDATGSTLQSASNLFESYGLGVALLPLLPAVLAVLPLVLPPRFRRAMGWVNAVLMSLFSVVGGFTLGGFFAPLALLMWAAVFVPLWLRQSRPKAFGLTVRILGAVMLITPTAFGVIGALTGTFMDPDWRFWLAAALTFALGVLFAIRLRYADVVVAGLGAALMLLAVVDAGLLALAVWWMGGLWFVIGLSAIAARMRPARS
ncbi:DUF1700 domain-containing protein [Gulosibacter molinativorax]|uniref:DUF1700 domain-containing protein n=1 Tax=Gulosibacter molinativorax TaxID=256821 RepID=A0ABT7C5M5_9MICO|nr:DUF1700 domain-containing protein [Gulosibacter molinativorax]MDJ1370496.1 DUF1700 domain-containing protein [Gulosibacter molinativorax]QUY62093.1 Hypotetical protein [Gulosibacter molinativorax]